MVQFSWKKQTKKRRKTTCPPLTNNWKKTALRSALIAVFSFICLGFLTIGQTEDWTEPGDLVAPDDTGKSQAPINLGAGSQTKAGHLILENPDETEGGLETSYWGNVQYGDLYVDSGQTEVWNNLLVKEALRVYADNPDPSILDGTVKINMPYDDAMSDHNDKDLQVFGQTKFYSDDHTGSLVTVNSTYQNGPAFLSENKGHSFGLAISKIYGDSGDAIWAKAGEASSGNNTFAVFGLAGARNPNKWENISYSGYLQGKVLFGAAPDNPPFYINSDVLVDNLNVDRLADNDGNLYDSSDFVLKETMAAAFIQAQAGNLVSQPGSLQLSGQAVFDQGVVTANLSAEANGSVLAAYGPSTDQPGQVSYGLSSQAGDGPGQKFAAYLVGPVYLGGSEKLSINSQAVNDNLNAQFLDGREEDDFLKKADIDPDGKDIDNYLVRLQTTSPGFSQTGSLAWQGQTAVNQGIITSKLLINNANNQGQGLLAKTNTPGGYAVYAKAAENGLAAEFIGQVTIDGHNLYMHQPPSLAAGGSSGSITIPAGQQQLELTAANYQQDKSLIFTSITSGSETASLIVEKLSDSFLVKVFSPDSVRDTAIEFSYFLLNQE